MGIEFPFWDKTVLFSGVPKQISGFGNSSEKYPKSVNHSFLYSCCGEKEWG